MRRQMKAVPRRHIGTTIAFCMLLGSSGLADGIEAESVLIRLIDKVDVPARAAGVLSTISVVEGQAVGKGELVAQIDDFESRLKLNRAELELELTRMQVQNDVSVRSAEVALSLAKTNYERLKEASDSLPRSVSASELDDLKSQMEQAMLRLEDARRSLALAKATQRLKENDVKSSQREVEIRRVVAPLSGLVEQVLRSRGEWVEPGEKVIRIIRVDRLRAEGFVRADAVEKDLTGAPVTMHLTTQGGQEYKLKGKVVFVHPQIDPVNGQMRVWAEIDNQRGLLRPGMRAQMTIVQDHVPNSPSRSAHALNRQP